MTDGSRPASAADFEAIGRSYMVWRDPKGLGYKMSWGIDPNVETKNLMVRVNPPPLTISGLITRLQEILAAEGDLPVYRDSDCEGEEIAARRVQVFPLDVDSSRRMVQID